MVIVQIGDILDNDVDEDGGDAFNDRVNVGSISLRKFSWKCAAETAC